MLSKAKITRRDLLRKGLGFAAGGISFPLFVRSSVFGKAGATAANDRVTLGFIGLGGKGFDGVWGALLPSFVANKGFHTLAVCDVDERYLDRAKKYVDAAYDNSDCAAYVDFRDLLARDDIDAVVIATPDHWHAVQTIQACQAGKDVYVEKPLSLTIEESHAMVQAARRYGRVVQTGSQSRSNERLRFACEAIRNGRIGKIKSVTAASGGPPILYHHKPEPTPDYLHWDLYVGPAPWRPFTPAIHPAQFRFNVDFAGGGVADWGAHHFDLVQWALGTDHTGPVEIIPPDDNEQKRLVFKYANGISVEHINLDHEQPDFFGVTFEGTQGRIQMQGISGIINFQPEVIGEECQAKVQVFNDIYSTMGHYDNFLECIRSRRKPAADVEIGARTANICHLVNIAYRLKRPLKWDPQKEVLVNDPQAAKFISRAMREPWTLSV